MLRLSLFCLGIPFKILILGIILTIGVFYIYDIFIEKTNPDFEGWDAWHFYFVVAIPSLLFSCILSLSAFFNFRKTVRKNERVSKATFLAATMPLLFPLVFVCFSKLYIIYLLVPLTIFGLQYYHYSRFRKGMRSGKYQIKDNE